MKKTQACPKYGKGVPVGASGEKEPRCLQVPRMDEGSVRFTNAVSGTEFNIAGCTIVGCHPQCHIDVILDSTWVKKDSEHGRWVAVLPSERPNGIIMKYGDKDVVYDRKNGKGVPVGASGEKEIRCIRTKSMSGCPMIPEDDFDTAPFVLMRWRRELFDQKMTSRPVLATAAYSVWEARFRLDTASGATDAYSWACSQCRIENPASSEVCEVCQTRFCPLPISSTKQASLECWAAVKAGYGLRYVESLNFVQPGDETSRRALAPFRRPNAGTYPTTKKQNETTRARQQQQSEPMKR